MNIIKKRLNNILNVCLEDYKKEKVYSDLIYNKDIILNFIYSIVINKNKVNDIKIYEIIKNIFEMY